MDEALDPYLRELFPSAFRKESVSQEPYDLPEVNPAFLNERSQSLLSQLVAPPPLQPLNWTKSRIRRLFLVALGVPVDLDEILPASKQKKLILPSLAGNMDNEGSSTSGLKGGAIDRLKNENGSSTSLNSSTSRQEKRRKGVNSPPELDVSESRALAGTAEAALASMSEDELKSHVDKLEKLKAQAVTLLEYWLIRKDSAATEKEALEEVIDNLVKHAKKVRK